MTKGDDHAGENFPWPPKSGTDPVTTRLLKALFFFIGFFFS
jgi:hypothetical protein